MGRGAKDQLFHRNQYLVVGLAPLVVITLAGISFTLVSPALASYTIFATAGNISESADYCGSHTPYWWKTPKQAIEPGN